MTASSVEEIAEARHQCPLTTFVRLISGKWAMPILYQLLMANRPMRFKEIQRAVSPITQKELTKQLRTFEQRGLVTRHIYAEMPPRVEYEPTELGKTLLASLTNLATWTNDHAPSMEASTLMTGERADRLDARPEPEPTIPG